MRTSFPVVVKVNWLTVRSSANLGADILQREITKTSEKFCFLVLRTTPIPSALFSSRLLGLPCEAAFNMAIVNGTAALHRAEDVATVRGLLPQH